MKSAARKLRLLALLAAIFLIASACGGGTRTGSEDIMKFKEQEDAERLGEGKASPSPAPEAAASPAPKQQASPPPQQAERFFDITLIASSPYYEPGNEIVMPISSTLRVTNKDTTPERPTRTFTAEDGSFDSGPLKPGQSWTHKFSRPGRFKVIDKDAPFIFANLEVR